MANYLIALEVLLALSAIIGVKGQPTAQICENGDSSNSIAAELSLEAIHQLNIQLQSIREILTESNHERKNQLDTAVTSLQADGRHSQNQIETIYKFINASFEDIKSQQDTVMARCSQEQVTSMYKVLNASFQQMKNQQEAILKILEALENDLSVIRNQTQTNYFELERALVSDVGEVPVLQPIVNDWIVFLNRSDGSLDFNRNWTEYKNGFGDTGRGEFWLGNEKVHRLTNTRGANYTLRIEMYINGAWYYAEYSTFSIDSESHNYTLRLSGFSGDAGDSLTNISLGSYLYLNGMSFSTRDVDNDRCSTGNSYCALGYYGGWWFNCCHHACLTCLYFRWYTLRHLESSGDGILRAARMMIKIK